MYSENLHCPPFENNLQLLQNLPFQRNYNFAFIFAAFQNNQPLNYQTITVSNNILVQNLSNTQYKSQYLKNIIIKAKQQKAQKMILSDEQTTKVHKKSIQKETRNVKSNLLRIFFKYLIQLKIYDKTVNTIKLKLNQEFDNKDFYKWILSFKINFKNYIRQSQLQKFWEDSQPQIFRKVLRILLHQYSNKTGILHCASSRRIERKSTKLHLQGLRDI